MTISKSICLLIVAGAVMMSAPTSAQDLVWEHDIKARTMHGWWVSGSGMPIIKTGPFLDSRPNRIEALDPNTGESLWQRSLYSKGQHIEWEMVPFSDRAISSNGPVLMDLKTGKDLWQPDADGFSRVYDYLQVPEFGLIIVHGPSGQGPHSFAALETATGKTRWIRGDLLSEPPVYECLGTESGLCERNLRGQLKGRPSFDGLQPALVYEDSIILFLSNEGPVRVNAQTGDVTWSSAFSGSPRHRANGNSPMRIEGDSLLIAEGSKLNAVDLKTGDILWPKPKVEEAKKRRVQFKSSFSKESREERAEQKGGAFGSPKIPGPVSIVETTPTSVLVYGHYTKDGAVKDKWFDLLDATTGTSRWAERFTEMKGWGRRDRVMVGDTTYFVTGNMRKLTLYEMSASGALREAGKLEIKGSLDMVEFYDGNILITSEEEMIMVRPKDASVVYKADYPAPEVRMAEVLLAGLVTTLASAGASKANEAVYKKQMKKGDVRSAAATAQNQHAIEDNLDKRLASQDTEVFSAITRLEDYVYFYVSKNAGGGARALVKVSKKDGKVTRKVPLDGIAREMNYELDLPNNRVIVQDKNGVRVKTLPPPDSGNPAASESASDIGSGGDDSVAGGDQPAAAVADPEQIAE